MRRHVGIQTRRWQAAYEAQLAHISATLDEHDAHLGELHTRVESLEAGTRMLPEILERLERLERLGPETSTPEQQRTVQNAVKRLHEVGGFATRACTRNWGSTSMWHAMTRSWRHIGVR